MGKPKHYKYQVVEHRITKELYVVKSCNVALKNYPVTVVKLSEVNKPITNLTRFLVDTWFTGTRFKKTFKILSKSKTAHITKSIKILFDKSK